MLGGRMLVNLAFVALAVPVVAWTTYLAWLAWLSFGSREVLAPSAPRTNFHLVVPAHDEEAGIRSTVESLLAVDYPSELRTVIVVADNCTDSTAMKAREAGATVLERTDPERRGKGYALAYAFERSIAVGPPTAPAVDSAATSASPAPDAVVVVDADTKVSPNLLRAFDSRLVQGAKAVQAEYCVANRDSSWRTRLMHIGFTLFHDLRSRGRERLRLSAGLRGNGMAFSTALLREVPHQAFSVVEDVEYGIRLGLAGYRVHYAGEARVFGEMVSSEVASRSQRRRWEGGRWALVGRHGVELLREGLARRSPLLLDLAADLLVPPLTYVALATFVGLVGSSSWVAMARAPLWVALPWWLALLGFSFYVARGLWLARVGPRVVLDLVWAPVYMAWKVALALRPSGARRDEWVRTAREGDKP